MSQRTAALLSSVLALGSLALACVMASAPARSADECIVSPNRAAPAGQHWYFRREPATKRQCWFLASRSTRVQKPAVHAAGRRVPDALALEPSTSPRTAASAATTAAGQDRQGPSDSSMKLRWPDPGRYVVASSSAPETIEGAAQVPSQVSSQVPSQVPSQMTSQAVSDARSASEPASPTTPSEPVQMVQQATPAPITVRVDLPPPESRVAPPHDPDHTLALTVTTFALMVIVALVWWAALWPRRREPMVERAGHTWLKQWRADRHAAEANDPHDEFEHDVPETVPAQRRGVEPFDWAQEFARAWQQLSEDRQAQQGTPVSAARH